MSVCVCVCPCACACASLAERRVDLFFHFPGVPQPLLEDPAPLPLLNLPLKWKPNSTSIQITLLHLFWQRTFYAREPLSSLIDCVQTSRLCAGRCFCSGLCVTVTQSGISVAGWCDGGASGGVLEAPMHSARVRGFDQAGSLVILSSHTVFSMHP